MTTDQEQHLDRLKAQAANMIDSKYRKGQAEHGGNIWDQNKNLLDNAIEEAIDMVVYLLTEKEKREGMVVPDLVEPGETIPVTEEQMKVFMNISGLDERHAYLQSLKTFDHSPSSIL